MNNITPKIFKSTNLRSTICAFESSEVLLLEGAGNYTVAHLVNGRKKVFSKTLKVYEEVFASSGFIRIHRNTVVNPSFIIAFNKLESSFVLKSLDEVTISRRRLRELRLYLKEQKFPIVEQGKSIRK
jgi:two-component system LytT family response regulator